MKGHGRKIIAPIIVTILLIAYFVVYFGVLIYLLDGILKYVMGIIPFIFSGLSIAVCIERIKEIRRGEEDDISKY